MTRRSRVSPIPYLFAIGGGLLLILAALLMTVPKAPAAARPTALAAVQEEESYPEIARVSLSEAQTALETGTALFVDVREAEAYAAGHIPGALSIPLADLGERLSELDPIRWIITYCT